MAQDHDRLSDHGQDERTPLLRVQRAPPSRDGYLDPDDPAVSPYNLWTVRLLRYFTFLFFFANFVWWTLLLVSIFVSPPKLHTRGSGFFDFAFVSLTGGNLMVALLFFAAPSKAMRVSSAIIASLLFVDAIIILSIPQLRREESAVGIISVLWAFMIATWCIVTDRVVASAKKEEEERLTGRAETRRTLREWLAVLLATVILVVFIAITLLMTGVLILRARDASLPMDGKRYLVDGGKYEVHFTCIGNVTHDKDGARIPTMLVESGEDAVEYQLEQWAEGAFSNKTISRYCYWDRPGYAFSDTAPSPHSAGMSATALSETIARAGERGPWVLVSAGYGSIVSRIFASVHPHDIAGILLIDPLHEDLLHRIGSPGDGFLLWFYGIISPLGLARIPGALFKGRSREDRVYGISSYQSGKTIRAHLQENLVAESLTKNEIISARAILDKKTPLAVISSGIECGRDKEWEKSQEKASKLTDRLVEWTVVPKAPHEVWNTLEGRNAMERALASIMKLG